MTAWVLSDPVTAATWTMPINPDKMTSPHPRKTLQHVRGTDGKARSTAGRKQAVEWSWEGVIRSQAHYDALLEWAQKPYPIEVTDHFGHTWSVVIQAFLPVDRRPNPRTPIRLRYTMQTLNLGRVA